MIVLDYLRSTSDGTIIVPPFQSGHLGFMPGREVQVYLVRPHMEQTHCEVVITPYQQNEQNLVRLTCVMDDQRGVVQRLIRSISTLGINIIAQESSSVHYQAYHYVSMLLDFSTSSIRDKRDPIPGAESRYAAFLPEAPLLQGRYVDLFESVIAHCGDVIKWTGASGVQSARFNIQPVESETDVRFHHPVTIGSPSLKGHKYNVSIQLEASLVAEIKLYLDTNSENLNYLLVSETDDRKLRAFFPKPEVVPRLIHLGFYHTDTPGTLAALLEPIKDARFNILTSLQRKHSQTINIWEAILEYQGEDDVPVGGEAQCRWVAEKLVSVLVGSEVTENIRRRNISVAPPRYPKGANTWKGRVEINDLLGPYNQTQKSQRRSESVGASRERLLDAISDRIFEMREAYVDEFDPRWRIVQSVKERVEKVRPTVFFVLS